MKIFESPQKDLEKNLSVLDNKLDVIQKQLRDLRSDNVQTHKDLRTIVKAVALLVSAPDPDMEELEAR